MRLQGTLVELVDSLPMRSSLIWPLIVYVARAISDYITSETGVTIIFESAIVPKWKDSRISFKNVYVSRRPTVSTSSSPVGHSAHHAALGYDVSNHPANHRLGDEEEEGAKADHSHADDDVNWSMFDMNVDSIDVTLSLWRWLDGKGMVKDAVVKGVRGVLGTVHSLWIVATLTQTPLCRPTLGGVVSKSRPSVFSTRRTTG